MGKENITKIKASDPSSSKIEKKEDTPKPEATSANVDTPKKSDKKAAKLAKKAKIKTKKQGKKPFILFRPFVAFGRYVRDSWRELRQVRWPSRKATWGMVISVFAYAAIIMAIITLLDMLFSYLSNLILG